MFVFASEWEREREWECMCVFVFVSEWERVCVCVNVKGKSESEDVEGHFERTTGKSLYAEVSKNDKLMLISSKQYSVYLCVLLFHHYLHSFF